MTSPQPPERMEPPIGARVRCKNVNWPRELGVIVNRHPPGMFGLAAVRYGQMTYSLITYVEDLEEVA